VVAAVSPEPLGFYYGSGQLDRLRHYHRVVLQPEFYPSADLVSLRGHAVDPLAYLSLTEDQGPPAPWQRDERNPDWGGAFVHVGHPGWIEHVLGQARAALAKGFTGVFLDTLNVELTFPEEVPHLLALVAAIREETRPRYVIANRGFGMLPRLAEFVDGILFESFSARWLDGGYSAWPAETLEVHAQIAEQLLQFNLDLYALDYADSPGLAAFARRRAHQFGLHCFVSDRALSRI
jgi:polysaccharide biosynthesis protein PelA